MKFSRCLLFLIFFVPPPFAFGQIGNVTLKHFGGVPSGSCSRNQQALDDTTGLLYSCPSGSWELASGSGASSPAAPLYVTNFGAKCDGSTNDTIAVNNAFAAAVAVGTSLGSAEVVFPAGICLGNFTIVQGKGLRVHGTGELSTRLRSPNGNPALQINGLWYSSFADMSFDTLTHSTANAILEIDGAYDGTHTQGVQFLTFVNVGAFGRGLSDGLRSYEAIAICRQGNNSGCQGSNLKFDTVSMAGCSFACLYQIGYNALANICVICDAQDFSQFGWYVLFGDMNILSSSAEAVVGWTQYLNNGCDIYDGAAYYPMAITDFRSESVLYACGTGRAQITLANGGFNPVPPDGGGLCISQGCSGDGSVRWAANTAFTAGQVTYMAPVIYSASSPTLGLEGDAQRPTYYVVTTPGTSGGSAPQWTYTGTVTDGSVVWTETTVPRINLPKAVMDADLAASPLTTTTSGGNYVTRSHALTHSPNRASSVVTYNTVIDPDDEYLLVDASSQNITIALNGRPNDAGRSYCLNGVTSLRGPLYIRRIDPANTVAGLLNTVTISTVLLQGDYASGSYGQSIQLPPDGYVELLCSSMESGSGQYTWTAIGGKYISQANAFSNTASAGAVTLNATSGFITTESLATAAGSDYVLTFSNNRISPNSIVQVNVMNGTNTGGTPALATVNTATSGQAVIDVHNSGGTAFNGTLTLKFLVF